jgi:hypothetical protein
MLTQRTNGNRQTPDCALRNAVRIGANTERLAVRNMSTV